MTWRSDGMLFEPGRIGLLQLPNRLVRSATAERMADENGMPRSQLGQLYQTLARGGVGLIITGHMYVHPSGKAHPEMTGIFSDELVPSLADLADVVHREGGLVIPQINHGGMQCSGMSVDGTIAPSSFEAPYLSQPAREMTRQEVEQCIEAYAQAARRAKAAGFDGVQLHGAHGYLISQFLSPFINRRQDEWGGDWEGRTRFLRSLCQAVREQVGADFPVLIKLGIADTAEGGLSLAEGVQVVGALASWGIDGIEISAGFAGDSRSSSRKGAHGEADEAYFRPWAHQARRVTPLPLILVGGLRSRSVMEDVLASGDADYVSMCRPLICEPDLPNRMCTGLQERSSCISANQCWAERNGEGIACKCPLDKLQDTERVAKA
jgi:2,4-dienoyl-CoA reductase-like NADH-dependent reductase (Old Yellow Enzyme family)